MEIALKTAGLLLPDTDTVENTAMEYPERVAARLGRCISDTLRWAMYMPTALGLLGSFRVEEKGAYAGRFNIRTPGIDPLAASVWAFAASKGIVEHNTLKCIFLLRMRRIISADMEDALADAYECLTEHLLTLNEHGRAGWVRPSALTRDEYMQIREAMRTIERFQRYIYENGTKEPPDNTGAIPFDSDTWERVPLM